jgi:hypothetical protein
VSHNPFAAPEADLEVRKGPELTEAERIRKEHLRAETNIKSIGSLYSACGLLGTFGAMVAVVMAGVDWVKGFKSEQLVVLLLVVLYPCILIAGISLRRFRTWARRVAVGFSALGLLAIPVGTIISVLFLYALLNSKANTVFTPQYQEIIRQTPHIQYRTSPVAWAALGVLVLLFALGVVAAFR